MNLKLENSIHDLLLQKAALYDAHLADLANTKIAIDACILLKVAAASSDPYKYVQEGGSSIDLCLQNGLEKIINQLKEEYNISLIIVLDGITPKVFHKSKLSNPSGGHSIWTHIADMQAGRTPKSNKFLFEHLVETYGSKLFSTEVLNAARATNTEFFFAPYMASSQIVYFYN